MYADSKRQHIIPGPVFVCDFPGCQKAFGTKFSMNRHKVVHSKDRNFKCDRCGRRFALSQYLKEHIYIHTNERPYICGIGNCTESFRQTGKLAIHRKTHWKDSQGAAGDQEAAAADIRRLTDVFVGPKEEAKLVNTINTRNPQPQSQPLSRERGRESSVRSAGTLDGRESKIKEVNCETTSLTARPARTLNDPFSSHDHISVQLKGDLKIVIRLNGILNDASANLTLPNPNKKPVNMPDTFLDYLEHIESALKLEHRPVLPVPEELKKEIGADVSNY
eukprot:TRINITY_DN12071_c0_g1_i7.p1 TRINITY_DN12071_c0_g1~~TRINITY_DN12071_c0_g1_i7.p1  ORF type:complete len:277 (-),score=29.20 TRINITY_DN12071_c0_g1_i7:144-974(-)